jgi:ATP-binding cassette subfamily B (MDR/TAP) protein 1
MVDESSEMKPQEGGQDGPSLDKKPEAEKAEREATFADYLRIFTYAEKWDFVVYFVASIASIGAGISLPLMIIIFGQLVNQFTDYFRDTDTMSPSDFEDILSQQALYIMALFFGRWVLNAINMYCFRMIGIRLSSAIRLHYLRCLLDQSIHVIDTMPAGAPATAITSTSNTLQLGISEKLGTFLQSQGTIWAALIIAFVWNWELTLVTSSLIFYLLAVMAVCIPPYLKVNDAATKADSKAIAIASEALGAMRLIMAFGAEQKFAAAYAKNVHEARKQAKKGAPVLAAQLGLIVCAVLTIQVR